ncbi:hypothetical protein scyTo_0006314 [Scyliorhinus torazame]|uniref:Uncharacterized protein n=1 Tax=Scyliorhinus torazame TaxID=75743 RepID=A0A401PH78_SCYTO|nr:hypothetical protein [Scyliorhinus torazame]
MESVRLEREARAFESVAVPVASSELSLALENPGEMVKDVTASIPPGGTEKYLGTRIDPWAGVTEGEWLEKLKTWTEALQAVALRPAQKVKILKTQVIISEVSQNTLREMDQIIWNSTKEFRQLPPYVTGGLLCSSNRNGGLGMPTLEVQIPSAIILKREALEIATDMVIRVAFQYWDESNIGTIGELRMLKG